MFSDKPQTMSLLSVCTELEENKTSDKARNSAKTALAPRAETGITDPRADTASPLCRDRTPWRFYPLSANKDRTVPQDTFIPTKLAQKSHTLV